VLEKVTIFLFLLIRVLGGGEREEKVFLACSGLK